MPSNFTASLRFEMQFTGENVNTWGVRLNSVIERVDYAIAGFLIVPVAANVVLSTSNTANDQARAAMLRFTGAGGFSVTIPSVSKVYVVENDCTAAVIVTTGSGDTVQVDPEDTLLIFCDGANVSQLGFDSQGIKDYIASVAFAASGTLPAQAGNAGKFVYTNGTAASWRSVTLTDLSDWPAAQASIIQLAFAAAVAL